MDFFQLVLVFFITLTFGKSARSEHHSGIYVDNGVDQTMVHRVVSHRHKRELGRNFVHLFNLPISRSRNTTKENDDTVFKTSSARWIHDAYYIKDQDEPKADEMFSADEINRIKNSHTIGTFKPWLRKKNELWFDYFKYPKYAPLMHAELLVHGASKATIYTFTEKYGRVAWWQLSCIQSTSGSWLKADVTKTVKLWSMSSRKSPQGFMVVLRENGTRRDLGPDEPGKEPFLVGYFARSENGLPSRRSTRRNPGYSYPPADRHPFFKRATERSGACRLHRLYVDLAQLNIRGKVVAPAIYEANFCEGLCRFPENVQSEDPTSHSIVQSLVHFQHPELVPEPSCSASEYEDQSIIYTPDRGANFFIHEYKSITAKTCRCQ